MKIEIVSMFTRDRYKKNYNFQSVPLSKCDCAIFLFPVKITPKYEVGGNFCLLKIVYC